MRSLASVVPPVFWAAAVPLGTEYAALTRRLVGIAVIALLAALPALGQGQDLNDHSPQGALWRAAVVPGWGQLYNKQYYKIPVVWAGLGGITASALLVNQRYLRYRHAFHFVTGVNTSPEYEADFEWLVNHLDITQETGLTLGTEFGQTRDNLRRNRDLLYIGVGLFYGLTILDAYVHAHLLDFDVGEDLTLSVQAAPEGLSATLHLRP